MDQDFHQRAVHNVCGICSKFISGKSHDILPVKKSFEQIFKFTAENHAPNMCGTCAWKFKLLENKSKQRKKSLIALMPLQKNYFPENLPSFVHSSRCQVCDVYREALVVGDGNPSDSSRAVDVSIPEENYTEDVGAGTSSCAGVDEPEAKKHCAGTSINSVALLCSSCGKKCATEIGLKRHEASHNKKKSRKKKSPWSKRRDKQKGMAISF
jgi:hypothetical protein